MPNHVHVIVVPSRRDSLAALFSEAHRQCTRRINQREEWRGHLWQERFHSTVLDERHLIAAVRYTELNPVRAGLCRRFEDWPWSSVHAHLNGRDDLLVTVRPMLDLVSDWTSYLQMALYRQSSTLRRHARTGRPLGEAAFVRRLEDLTERRIQKAKPGRTPN